MSEGNSRVKNAVMLGVLCSIAYLAVYIARNILGALTPQIVESGAYTNEFIGSISSLYFVFYAVGQLLNGVLGDRIKAGYMISLGLILAGACTRLFPVVRSEAAVGAVYAMTGFFLSMIYAPMTKVVSESTEQKYAVRCSLGYTFSSFFGSPVAGLMASAMVWQSVFTATSVVLFVMGAVCLVCFFAFERRGIVKYKQSERQGTRNNKGSIKELLRRDIAAYTVFSLITGIIRTTVIFWLPTYLAEHLGFSSQNAATIFSGATLVICFSSFFAVFVYERINRKIELSMLIMFVASTAFFTGAYFADNKTVNIIFIVAAIFFNNSAASVLWSVYCPSLADTGVVSTATGFLDFASYMAAAVSSTVFANSVSVIGWGNLILVWTGLMAVGVVVSLIIFRKADTK